MVLLEGQYQILWLFTVIQLNAWYLSDQCFKAVTKPVLGWNLLTVDFRKSVTITSDRAEFYIKVYQ